MPRSFTLARSAPARAELVAVAERMRAVRFAHPDDGAAARRRCPSTPLR